MKTLTPEYEAALESGDLKLAVLVEIDHPAGFVRLHSGIGSLVWNGNTYKGVGALGRIEGIGETADIRTTETRYSLIAPALDADAMAIVMQSPRGRAVKAWLALMDESWAVIQSPIQLDHSIIENIESAVGADGIQILSLPATSAIFDFIRPSGAAITNEAQQNDFPGDTGFDRMPTEVADKELSWTDT
jgi:hypothetical protein